ncbi:MAG: hypothetical protein ABSF67_00075 [Roseiarcus sp.]|jgi:hypothetical protein
MDAEPPFANGLARDLWNIRRGLPSPLAPTIFDGSFIELDVTRDVTRDQHPPTALEKARARWRYAQIAE